MVATLMPTIRGTTERSEEPEWARADALCICKGKSTKRILFALLPITSDLGRGKVKCSACVFSNGGIISSVRIGCAQPVR